MLPRYDIRPDLHGDGWTVYDATTGLPVLLNDVPQVGLDVDDSDDLADLLSHPGLQSDAPHD